MIPILLHNENFEHHDCPFCAKIFSVFTVLPLFVSFFSLPNAEKIARIFSRFLLAN